MSKFFKFILLLTIISLGIIVFSNKKEPTIETKQSQNIIESKYKSYGKITQNNNSKSGNTEKKLHNKDYSVLVSSNDYNAVILLNLNAK